MAIPWQGGLDATHQVARVTKYNTVCGVHTSSPTGPHETLSGLLRRLKDLSDLWLG